MYISYYTVQNACMYYRDSLKPAFKLVIDKFNDVDNEFDNKVSFTDFVDVRDEVPELVNEGTRILIKFQHKIKVGEVTFKVTWKDSDSDFDNLTMKLKSQQITEFSCNNMEELKRYNEPSFDKNGYIVLDAKQQSKPDASDEFANVELLSSFVKVLVPQTIEDIVYKDDIHHILSNSVNTSIDTKNIKTDALTTKSIISDSLTLTTKAKPISLKVEKSTNDGDTGYYITPLNPNVIITCTFRHHTTNELIQLSIDMSDAEHDGENQLYTKSIESNDTEFLANWYTEDSYFEVEEWNYYEGFTVISAITKSESEHSINQIVSYFPDEPTDEQLLTAKAIKDTYPYPSPFTISDDNKSIVPAGEIQKISTNEACFNEVSVLNSLSIGVSEDNRYNNVVAGIDFKNNVNDSNGYEPFNYHLMSAAAIDTLIDKKIAAPHNTTITHYTPIEESINSITDFIIGSPVYLTGKVYKYDKQSKSFTPSTVNDSIDCICSVKTNGDWKEFVGICVGIDEQNKCVTFSTGGDYLVRVTDTSCYGIGDEVFVDEGELKVITGQTAITSKIRRTTVGIITGIIDKHYLAVIKY